MPDDVLSLHVDGRAERAVVRASVNSRAFEEVVTDALVSARDALPRG